MLIAPDKEHISAKERVSARVSSRVLDTIKEAANLVGATVSQFVASAAFKEAQSVLERERTINLTQQDAKIFFDMLETPPEANKKLKDAIHNHRESPPHDKDRGTQQGA